MAGDYFKGYISTVRMYNRTLSESELRKLAREWKKPVPDAPVGTSGILISSSNTISAGKFHKNESAEIPSSGLLLHASLEQDSETAETGQTFTKSGNVAFETVQGMKCAHFDGNSYWQVPFESDLAGNTAKAVSLWMWGTKDMTEAGQAWAFGVGSWSSSHAFGVGQASASSYSNRIYATMFGGDCSAESPLATSDFHHIVFQYNLSKTELFVDGMKLKEVNYSSANTSSSYPITIGWNGMNVTYNKRFTGYISGVRVYNRALSEMEIQNLSNEWQRTGRTNKIFIPVMDKIETEPTMFEKIADIVNKNAGVTYTTEVSTFGTFDSSAKWMGGVLANGKIYGIPHAATEILVIDTENDTTSTISCESGSGKWYGGCLAPNGKIYCIPYISNKILVIDPITNSTYEFDSPTGDRKWNGGVVGSDGKIYCIPCLSDSVLVIDPETDTTETFGDLSSVSDDWKWIGGTLYSDGNIYAFPARNDNKYILKINPTKKEVELIEHSQSFDSGVIFQGCVPDAFGKIWPVPYKNSTLVSFSPLGGFSSHSSVGTTSDKWFGGALAPNGKIYFAPYSSTKILEVDPATGGTLEIDTGSSVTGKYRGCVLAPNGSVYFIPCFATSVMKLSFSGSLTNFSQEICESAVLNKF